MNKHVFILVFITSTLFYYPISAEIFVPINTHDSLQMKNKRFSNITEGGFIYGFGNALLTTGGLFLTGQPTQFIKYKNENKYFSLSTINGYEFNHNIFLGLGLGAEIEENKINLPIFADYRITLFNRKSRSGFCQKITPVIDVAAGYAYNWMKSATQHITLNRGSNIYETYFTPISDSKGGAIANAQIGIRVRISNNFSWILGLGYRFQKIRCPMKFTDYQGLQIGSFNSNELTHFLTFKTGFTF